MQTNKSLDGHSRKRIYLFRHGEVNYMPSGKVVEDPNQVDLTEKGLFQAKLIDENTKKISFIVFIFLERAICCSTRNYYHP